MKRQVMYFYWIHGLFALIPAYVIERLFWESRGMTVLDVVWTELIFGMTILLLEVPTGVLADRWRKKTFIQLAIVLEGAMFIILLFAHSFWAFALAIVLAGAGSALMSGAANALLYEMLELQGRAGEMEKHLGRLQAVTLICAMTAAFTGSYVVSALSFEAAYWLSVLSLTGAFAVSCLLKEVRGGAEGVADSPIVQVKKAVMLIRSLAPAVVLIGMVAGVSIGFVDEFWQLYLADRTVPVYYFGLFSSIMMLVQLPGSLMAWRLIDRWAVEPVLRVITLASGILLITSFFTGVWGGVGVLLSIMALSGAVEPMVIGYLQKHAPDPLRATVESLYSLLFYAVLLAVGGAFGYIATAAGSVGSGFALLGGCCIVIALKKG